MMSDYIFRGSLSQIDPDVEALIHFESERQARKLIMIPSESQAPIAILEAMGSVFQNIYAEGYPDDETRWMEETEILDYASRLNHYRRYADPRYYKGVEYADIVESLARRRCAEAFSTEAFPANSIFANVQPLSGAPANNAIYTALINPGDTILGMNLLHGGHLSHGSSVNRSGKLFKVIHYNVDPSTEQIDYDAVERLARENNPKIIIAGYSSYPWIPDYARFRQIADSVGAILLADISHIAGMTAAGVIPSPIGYAQVISFTTHKTLCGPRGACILTTDATLAKKIDRAVFPGEQGGPHVHIFAALAASFKLVKTEQFHDLQHQILKNCEVLAERLKERGLRIPFGGTNSHLLNVDCKTVVGSDGTPLSGDMAARVLDLAGIVCNRNTIPGDKTALFASGIRLGTPWITQRGFKEPETIQVADIIADVLAALKPYSIETRQGPAVRVKIDFEILEAAKSRVEVLIQKVDPERNSTPLPYPHQFSLQDKFTGNHGEVAFNLSGKALPQFLNYVFKEDIELLSPGKTQKTLLWTPIHGVDCRLTCLSSEVYQVVFAEADTSLAVTWLRDLSDGYTFFDADITRRLHGPISVVETTPAPAEEIELKKTINCKPYYIGINTKPSQPLPEFHWVAPEEEETRKTPLFQTHVRMGAKMVPFAGWEMPVWYTSVVEEHLATRQAAGLFDVSHMGVFQAEGPWAGIFLDGVCGNDILALQVGESCYTHLLDPQAAVIDDCLVYRRGAEKYLVVVNASNNDKDWAWLNSVQAGQCCVDTENPGAKVFGKNVILRNLRDPKEGVDMRVDIALQGPKSRDILLALGCNPLDRKRIMSLKRTELCEAVVGDFDLIVSRTGYTGEKMAFELFVHPGKATALWEALLAAGTPMGLKPCGLGARDSLRTEAGLPLYGHEFTKDGSLGVAEGGFGSYVKTYKPWFIGRKAFIEKETQRNKVVARFRFMEKAVRMAHNGDPVLDVKGRVIGNVTSCAVDSEGFLTGQAFIEIKVAVEGTPISVFQSASKSALPAPAELQPGDRFTLPTSAVIVSRFPKL
jgi:glycine hydroxymethyltransferase